MVAKPQSRNGVHRGSVDVESPVAIAPRKRPWLLALTAMLVALWIGFLTVMAWQG